MNTFEALNQTFGLPVTAEEIKPPAVIQPVQFADTAQDTLDDYEKTRETLHELIDKGNDALDHMLEIAKASESPRQFEVVGQLVKTVAETAKDLIELQKSMRELKKTEQPTAAQQQTIQQQNNIVFSGSTADLLKQLRNVNDNVINNTE